MTTKDRFPVSNSTKPFWDSENDPFRKFRSTEELPSETDVLIVGSGFSGSSVAYYLSLEDNPLSTLLLEAREICSGATGRNGGHCRPDYVSNMSEWVETYGQEKAAEIGNFEYDNLLEVQRVLKEHSIDCDFILSRTFGSYITDDDALAEGKADVKAAMSNPYNKMIPDIFVAEGEAAIQLSHITEAKLVFSFTAAQLWPYKLVKGLLKVALAKKEINVQANTPVKEIITLEDGTFLVKTPRGEVKAKKVVLATNGYTAALSSKFEDKIVPIKASCSQIVPIDEGKRAPNLMNSCSVVREKGAFDYLINRADGSCIVGGGMQFYTGDKDAWYDTVDDSTLFYPESNPLKTWYDTFMQKTFFSWENVTTKVAYLWSGITGYTADGLPYTGEIPGEPNKYVTAGFNGHGMPRIMLCSKAISECLLEGKTIQETAIPKTFMLTPERLAIKENGVLESQCYYEYHKG